MRHALLLVALAVLLPGVARAHAVVEPARAAPRAYQRYVLRVPNEFQDAATTRVEIRFPAGLRVISFVEVPGWQLEVVRDSARRVTGAIWTGSLPPERFIEFPFMAVNPDSETRLVWPVKQSYSTGEVVDWAGPEDSDRPASATEIGAGGGDGASRVPMWVAVGAAGVALLSLGLAVQARRRTHLAQAG
jgi:uncharacterized protein YcnI